MKSKDAKPRGGISFPVMHPTPGNQSVSMYPATFSLSKPEGEEKIPAGNLAYMRARNRNRIYDLVAKEFIASKISQADLAKRMGRGTDVVCRLLGAPGNWTLDTLSDLLFGISGGEARYVVGHPFDEAKRNYTGPEWVPTQPGASTAEFYSATGSHHSETKFMISGTY